MPSYELLFGIIDLRSVYINAVWNVIKLFARGMYINKHSGVV